LNGEKLHGKWALVRMGGRAAREKRENWLLIKEKDEFTKPGSGSAVVDENPLSVESGRDMATIAAQGDRVWDSAQGERKVAKAGHRGTRRRDRPSGRKWPVELCRAAARAVHRRYRRPHLLLFRSPLLRRQRPHACQAGRPQIGAPRSAGRERRSRRAIYRSSG